jgi:hypothetical protein
MHFRYAHLKVNSYSHVTMVEQLMSWINLDSKQFPLSNQFVVRRTHCKKWQLNYTALGSANASVDKGLVQKFNNSLDISSSTSKSYKFVSRKPKGSHLGSSKGPSN